MATFINIKWTTLLVSLVAVLTEVDKARGIETAMPVHLRKGYKLLVRMHYYRNAYNIDAEDSRCDWILTDNHRCDPKFLLKISNPVTGETRSDNYPGEDDKDHYSDVDDLKPKDFAAKKNPQAFVFVNDTDKFVGLHLHVVDDDYVADDLITSTNTELKLTDLQLGDNIRTLVKYRGLHIAVQLQLSCNPKTCGDQCTWIENGVTCQDNQVICEEFTFHPECFAMLGNFLLAFTLSEVQLQGDSNQQLASMRKPCVNKLMICIDGNNSTECKSGWQTLLETSLNVSNISTRVLTGVYDIYDYRSELNQIARSLKIRFKLLLCRKQAVFMGEYSYALEFGPDSNVEVDRPVVINEVNDSVVISGNLLLKCQQFYDSPNCRKPCSSCNETGIAEVCPGEARRAGPKCSYQRACFTGGKRTCLHGGMCQVERASITTDYSHKCDCKPGYSGAECQIVSGIACNNSTCKGHGDCEEVYQIATGSILPKCNCYFGYSGTNCELCNPTTENLDCENLIGNFSLVLELEKVSNKKGKLANGDNCDDGYSECDMQVSVCVDNECKDVLSAKNRAEISAHSVPSDVQMYYYQKSFSVLSDLQTFELYFRVTDKSSTSAFAKVDDPVIASFNRTFTYRLEYTRPYSFTVEETSETGFYLLAHLTVLCAHGFYGGSCSRKCSARTSKIDVAYSPKAMQFETCQPIAIYQCADEKKRIGPSCVSQNFCKRRMCKVGEQCIVYSGSRSADCLEEKPNVCTKGEETCSRRGNCSFDEKQQTAKCICDEGFGGKRCDIENWCGSSLAESPCDLNGTCLLLSGTGLYMCFCRPDNLLFSNVSTEPLFCTTIVPCDLANCQNDAGCAYELSSRSTKCFCKPGFGGKQCEVPWSSGNFVLPIGMMTMLVAALCVVLLAVAATICNRHYKTKEQEARIRDEATYASYGLTLTQSNSHLTSRQLSKMLRQYSFEN